MKPPALRATLAAVLTAFAATSQAALDVAGLDRTIDACTDFYQFANRSWLQATPIPGDRPRWGTFEIIGESNEKVAKAFSCDAARALLPENSRTAIW